MRARRLMGWILALWMILGAARGEMYIDQEEFDEIYAPYCRLEGDTVTVFEGVESLGDYGGRWTEDPVTGEWERIEKKEDAALFDDFCLWFSREDFSFRKIVLPSTLKALGDQSFYVIDFDGFTLPDTLELICDNAFIYCSFDSLRIETALPYEQIAAGLYDCTVSAYETPEDHPLYRAVDGVLFSKDGKTLLAYPNGRRDMHYDVPAGVEHIGERAFSNEHLKTVSLPIGLKTVGDLAFAGCTRLQAIALPLTVTQIGERIFGACVSLELVSLPAGLSAERGGWGASYYGDEKIYRGDNGDTGNAVYTWTEALRGDPVRLMGAERIPVYLSEAGNLHFYLPEGTLALGSGDGVRIKIKDMESRQLIGYVDQQWVRSINNETLFSYADALPPAGMEETDDGEYEIMGPFIEFTFWDDESSWSGFFQLQDAVLYREPVEREGVYGFVFRDRPQDPLPLYDGPGGAETAALYSGAQVRVLEEQDDWMLVTTGFEEGWLPRGQVRIVPVKNQNDQEE